jgi:4-hydroxy-3-methylbut-2-en-1-yl diphosphate reductase
VTSGASAPEILVEAMVRWLAERGATEVRVVNVIDEDVFFPLPPELAQLQKSRAEGAVREPA